LFDLLSAKRAPRSPTRQSIHAAFAESAAV
jgi:hypothetical protein